ncbi:hypothetical protein BSL78_27409 [Apostichopus japonicus]|uniref:Uncharacterized protein n=1 Tax=Stichopus japonicus TaxID=307972 RepID=A0A2G8JJ41_STIJA|nr:hypothetical protein BSL78_27409 [Apostichopus japonicus]
MEANLQKRAKGKYKSLKNLTSPEKRKWRKTQKQRFEATRIHLGNQVERWTELKEKLGLKNDTEVARYLLDRVDSAYSPCKTPNIGLMTSTPVSSSIDRDSDPDWDSGEEDADSSDMSVDLNVSHPEQPADLDLDTILSFAETDQSEDEDVDDGTGSEACAEDTLFITYKESLLQLLKDCRPKSCVRESCQSPPQEVTKFVGTAVGVKWICAHGHVSKIWHSQPKLKGNNAGDIAVSAAVILSGNNYAKIKMMFRFMNLGMCHSALHSYSQRTYTFPAIEAHWKQLQTELLLARKGKTVVIAGDGRNDSPGHCAQYCTYSVMDYETCDILDIQVVDKREADLKSTNMEKIAFLRALETLEKSDVKVEEVVTDAHPQIKSYPNYQDTDSIVTRMVYLKFFFSVYCTEGLEGTTHSFDVWHGAKNIGKKLSEAAKKARNRPLMPWISDITRHFWYCSQHADGSADTFFANWRGILHHVVGDHEWALGDGVSPACCQHGPLPASQKDLEPDSPAHAALREIVLDMNLIRNIKYYTKFRHTSALENFQSHVLVYAAKRFAYGPPSYKARNLLAGIDYQHHKGRRQAERDGEPV